MDHLCTSFWFWFVGVALVTISIGSAWVHGYFFGSDLGRRTNDHCWEVRVKGILDRMEKEIGGEEEVTR